MNKRIQELMEQAQDWVDQRAPFASEEHEWFAEKFAELIVRECMDICLSEDWEDQQGWGKFFAQKIKLQIGVG